MGCLSSENNYFFVFYYNILSSVKNKETLEIHIQGAQQQIMESVKNSNPSSLKIKAKHDKNTQSTRSQEHELCHQRWVIECGFVLLL